MDNNLYNRQGEVIGQRRNTQKKPLEAEYQPGFTLALERFNRPSRHYRLIWRKDNTARLAKEDATEYKQKAEAIKAGQALRKITQAVFSR